MSVRVQRLSNRVPDDGTEIDPSSRDAEVLETTVDGQTFAWGPGQIRNFLDDGLGRAHGAFDGSEDAITVTGFQATDGIPQT